MHRKGGVISDVREINRKVTENECHMKEKSHRKTVSCEREMSQDERLVTN